MGTSTIVVIVVVVVLVAAAALLARPLVRRRRLQGRFGEEYDRVLERHDNRSEAESELMERERRHSELEITPLSAAAHARYTAAWTEVQARFVDEPEKAVRDADELVTALLAERGYPTGDHDEQAAILSIDHSRTLGNYRSAHETHQRIDSGEVSTENLREAMVQYRALFVDLLGTDHGDANGNGRDGRFHDTTDHDRVAGERDTATTGHLTDPATDAAAAARTRHAAR
jgi:phage gp37-like protein